MKLRKYFSVSAQKGILSQKRDVQTGHGNPRKLPPFQSNDTKLHAKKKEDKKIANSRNKEVASMEQRGGCKHGGSYASVTRTIPIYADRCVKHLLSERLRLSA